MKKLLNTLYVTTPNRYLALDGENIVIEEHGEEVGRLPLHNLESILCFGYVGASPALMGKCAEMNISLSFLKPDGRFLAKVTGKAYGNILLRKIQYRVADDSEKSLEISRNFIAAKIFNSRSVVDRAVRDHRLRIDEEQFRNVSEDLRKSANLAMNADNKDTLRGIEGKSALRYFSVFDDMILQQKDDFYFHGRNRRPPMDNVNAMLSFAYTLLTGMCVSALETVGLDPYAGFFHTDRPGRCSLALDLMEELRPVFADRFVLSLINRRSIQADGFIQKENGAIIMEDSTRKAFLYSWQNKKQETITHPFLNEKLEWGMVPYVQALLLARYLRGDLDGYPSFLWK